MVYETRLELARIIFADHDAGVVAIAAQPFALEGATPRGPIPMSPSSWRTRMAGSSTGVPPRSI